jgi:hypothetical protein
MTESDLTNCGYEEIGSPEQLGALFAALAKAQTSFGAIHRSKTVNIKTDKGAYSFAYAPLEDLIEATRPALAANGLAVLTPMVRANGGNAAVRTILAHAEGGRIASSFEFSPLGDIKQMAGQVTYLRRYGYSALLCLASDDDAEDNQEAMPSHVEPHRAQNRKPAEPSPAEVEAKERTAQAMRAFEQRNGGESVAPARKPPSREDYLVAYGDRYREAMELNQKLEAASLPPIDLAGFDIPSDAEIPAISAKGTALREAMEVSRQTLDAQLSLIS